MPERNDLFQVVGQQLSANVDPTFQRLLILNFNSARHHHYLRTPEVTTEPFMIGTTWVKENPESTSNMHSGEGRSGLAGSSKRSPNGARAAAEPTDVKIGGISLALD